MRDEEDAPYCYYSRVVLHLETIFLKPIAHIIRCYFKIFRVHTFVPEAVKLRSFCTPVLLANQPAACTGFALAPLPVGEGRRTSASAGMNSI